ncbi:unnamed protein product, partial [Pleuronectes platessa]
EEPEYSCPLNICVLSQLLGASRGAPQGAPPSPREQRVPPAVALAEPAFRACDGHRPAVQEKESPRTSDAVRRHRMRTSRCRTLSLRWRGEEGDGATAPPAAARAQRFYHKYEHRPMISPSASPLPRSSPPPTYDTNTTAEMIMTTANNGSTQDNTVCGTPGQLKYLQDCLPQHQHVRLRATGARWLTVSLQLCASLTPLLPLHPPPSSPSSSSSNTLESGDSAYVLRSPRPLFGFVQIGLYASSELPISGRRHQRVEGSADVGGVPGYISDPRAESPIQFYGLRTSVQETANTACTPRGGTDIQQPASTRAGRCGGAQADSELTRGGFQTLLWKQQ